MSEKPEKPEPRKKFIIANWKMNFTVNEASLFLLKLSEKLTAAQNLTFAVAAPFTTLQPLSLQIDRRKIKLAAQNLFYKDFGAFTGEISGAQLKGLVDFVLVGHSERRHILNESENDIRRKVPAALRNNIRPVLCIGETADERNFGETADILYSQLLSGLADVSREEIDKVILAYEPVWAISTSKNAQDATAEQVLEVFAKIREIVANLHGRNVAENMTILYGGSVNPSNAYTYLPLEGIDGALVGGASLKIDTLFDTIEIMKKVMK
jgi:triosephosphate isomerase